MDIRLRLGLIIGSGYLLWSGGEGVQTALSNRAPTSASCSGYTTAGTEATWLELTNCEVRLIDASHFYQGADSMAPVSQIYVPLHTPGAPDGTRTNAFLATRDTTLVRIYNGFADLQSQEQAEAYLAANAAKIAEVRTVSGLVRHGINMDAEEHSLLAGGEDAAGEFVIIDEGKKPTMSTALLLFAAGTVLAFFALGLNRLFSRPDPAPRA